jgi:hypothetical protein
MLITVCIVFENRFSQNTFQCVTALLQNPTGSGVARKHRGGQFNQFSTTKNRIGKLVQNI